MSDPVEFTDLQQVQQAEEKLLQALNVAATAVEELARIGHADRQAVTQLCQQFLALVKESHSAAKPLAKRYIEGLPYEYNMYYERAQADLSRSKAQALQEQMRHVTAALPPAAAIVATAIAPAANEAAGIADGGDGG